MSVFLLKYNKNYGVNRCNERLDWDIWENWTAVLFACPRLWSTGGIAGLWLFHYTRTCWHHSIPLAAGERWKQHSSVQSNYGELLWNSVVNLGHCSGRVTWEINVNWMFPFFPSQSLLIIGLLLSWTPLQESEVRLQMWAPLQDTHVTSATGDISGPDVSDETCWVVSLADGQVTSFSLSRLFGSNLRTSLHWRGEDGFVFSGRVIFFFKVLFIFFLYSFPRDETSVYWIKV